MSDSRLVLRSVVVSPKGNIEGLPAGQMWGWLASHRGERVNIMLKVDKDRRSGAQNGWYWSQIVPAVAAILSKTRDVPISSDQAHYVLKSAFIGQIETELGPAPKSSRVLSTAEFADYCDRICAHYAAEGQYIPRPDDPR